MMFFNIRFWGLLWPESAV